MSELLTNPPGERKLWYDGPNYTADAVILDLATDKILLIERRDTGQWALPGGFIDRSGESSLEAAIREAEEEAGVTGLTGGDLFYRGGTSDRRSSAVAWIETSAHLFELSSDQELTAGDDARATMWHDLGNLPPLYGAHQMLVERALDHSGGAELFEIVSSADTIAPVEGGYMQYDKWIAEKSGNSAFVKCSPKKNPRYDELQSYIEKEAGVMSHLRRSGFRHVPEKSAIRGNKLVMDALPPSDGWQWQMDPATIDAYLRDVLTAFSELETIPLPTDVFAVEDSYESILSEGWQSYDEKTQQVVTKKFLDMLPQLDCASQERAAELIEDIPLLQKAAQAMPKPDTFVLCHYDVRQSNFAWHPEKGVKIIDWSWAGPGLPGTDSTGLLIDLHKNGYDVSGYADYISPEHCLNMIGFWLKRSTLPNYGLEGLREQQFMSAMSAHQLLTGDLKI